MPPVSPSLRHSTVTPAVTLSVYIARQFTAAVLAMLAALTGLVALFDFIELLRRSASHPEASFGLVTEIELLRLPYIGHASAAIRGAAGRDAELLAADPVFGAHRGAGRRRLGLGVPRRPGILRTALGDHRDRGHQPGFLGDVRPRGDAGQHFLTADGGPLDLTNGQLWLRQADRGLVPRGVAIVHAANVALHGDTLTANRVTVFRLNDADQLLSRIEATQGRSGGRRLDPGSGAHVSGRTPLPEPPTTIILPTDLTVARVQESFASPDTLSVWELPGFHPPAQPLGLLLDPASAAFPGAAGVAAAVRRPWRWSPRVSPCARRAGAASPA